MDGKGDSVCISCEALSKKLNSRCKTPKKNGSKENSGKRTETQMLRKH